jgi:hypothetical protein
VLPVPTASRPPEFAGAIGQWNLEYEAKPTTVNVGDPITVTLKITGTGNLDTVPALTLTGLDNFKTYDATTKSTKNDLHTSGERIIQQVVIAKDTSAAQLPAVSLAYFDPVTRAYQTIRRGPIPLTVKAGAQAAIVSAGPRLTATEKLGQDIVYLKGDRGAATATAPIGWPAMLAGNLVPVLGLAGFWIWKRQRDKLAGNRAFARRQRAARQARQLLAAAADCAGVQRALQEYLGDRFDIAPSGITGAIVEERGLPESVRKIFAAVDAARYAGAATDLPSLKQTVEQVIDDLERATT